MNVWTQLGSRELEVLGHLAVFTYQEIVHPVKLEKRGVKAFDGITPTRNFFQ